MTNITMRKYNSNFEDFFFRRIINKKNFTYRCLISCLDPYLKKEVCVFDAGCGEGNLSMYAAKRCSFVLGLDLSREYIQKCRKKSVILGLTEKTKFIVMDILNDLMNETFDLVVCFEVLEHVKNIEIAIKKLKNTLKQSAYLIISTPSRNAPLFRLGLTKREDRRSGHLRRYTMEELTGLLKNASLKIVETRKTEGIFRNFLFYNRLGLLPLKFANRFTIISDLFTFIDNITLKLFGESQIIIVAQKPGKEKK